MTKDELAGLDMTEEELTQDLMDLKRELEAGNVRFASGALTPDLEQKFLKIQHRKSDNGVRLESIDVETALLVRTMVSISKATKAAHGAVHGQTKSLFETVEQLQISDEDEEED